MMSQDFFAEQRRQRIRSQILIAAVFGLLWSLANAFLFFTHVDEVCNPGEYCHSVWRLDFKVLAVTALVVGAYLGLGTLIAHRSAVHPTGVRRADGPDGAVLREVAAEMAIAAGVPAPACYIIDDPALNAFALSSRRGPGAVLCTSGLLAALDRRELRGVVAHEIAHIRNRDSQVVFVAVLGLGAIVAALTFLVAVVRAIGHGDGDDDNAGAAFLAFLAAFAALALLVIALPAAFLLRAALSRRREQLADASAVQFTRDPGGLRRALEKFAGASIPIQHVQFTTRSLWIDHPSRLLKRPRFYDRLVDTHPPIAARIAWLRELEGATA